MNNTPTPKTDAAAWPETDLVEGNFARQLETELAAVTEQLKDANERITELKSDRSILTQDGERWREIAIRMQHQRDTLAEALKWVGGFAYAGGKSFAEVEPVESALQTLNQPQPTKPEPR